MNRTESVYTLLESNVLWTAGGVVRTTVTVREETDQLGAQ